VKLGSTRWEPA
jgi:hypothetical protein